MQPLAHVACWWLCLTNCPLALLPLPETGTLALKHCPCRPVWCVLVSPSLYGRARHVLCCASAASLSHLVALHRPATAACRALYQAQQMLLALQLEQSCTWRQSRVSRCQQQQQQQQFLMHSVTQTVPGGKQVNSSSSSSHQCGCVWQKPAIATYWILCGSNSSNNSNNSRITMGIMMPAALLAAHLPFAPGPQPRCL